MIRDWWITLLVAAAQLLQTSPDIALRRFMFLHSLFEQAQAISYCRIYLLLLQFAFL